MNAARGPVRGRRAIAAEPDERPASSLGNTGPVQESVAPLLAEREQPSDELDEAVSAVLALALTSVGREREAVSVAVAALAPQPARDGRLRPAAGGGGRRGES